jgi:hypothetical protein
MHVRCIGGEPRQRARKSPSRHRYVADPDVPDGHGPVELTKFRNPKLVEIEPAIAPPNTLGLRSDDVGPLTCRHKYTCPWTPCGPFLSYFCRNLLMLLLGITDEVDVGKGVWT